MFGTGHQGNEGFGDRAIAAAIAALCGFLLGVLGAKLSLMIFGQSFGLAWFLTVGSAVFGFIAPGLSRDLWSTVWTAILRFFSGLLDTRRFYR